MILYTSVLILLMVLLLVFFSDTVECSIYAQNISRNLPLSVNIIFCYTQRGANQSNFMKETSALKRLRDAQHFYLSSSTYGLIFLSVPVFPTSKYTTSRAFISPIWHCYKIWLALETWKVNGIYLKITQVKFFFLLSSEPSNTRISTSSGCRCQQYLKM